MKNVHQLRDIGDTMHDMAVEILEEALKEGHEAVARQIDRGKDIIGVLSMHSAFGRLPLIC